MIAILDLLCQIILAAEGVPSGIREFAALIQKARAARRELSAEELSALQIQDDQSQAVLDAAIARLQGEQ